MNVPGPCPLAETEKATHARRRRHRDRYEGSIADGELLRSEISTRTLEPEYVLGLRGQF